VVSAITGSIGAVLRDAAARLAAAGCDMPRLDAEVLLGLACGSSRAELVTRGGEALPPAVLARFTELVARRAAREPVAYITGCREFRRIGLAVDARVLIPRPETELLVEVGLSAPRGARVVDVGTGSGAVALAVKDERPDLDVSGIDVSEDALAVARGNAGRLGLEVCFERGDLLAGRHGFDAVLANLPYVGADTPLPPEIVEYEPPEALFAGPDGLAVVRRLVSMLDGVPLVALEVGFDQADAVAELVSAAGFARIERRRDLAGHERVVVGRR
jgi:release factor glutamine methyltransferase